MHTDRRDVYPAYSGSGPPTPLSERPPPREGDHRERDTHRERSRSHRAPPDIDPEHYPRKHPRYDETEAYDHHQRINMARRSHQEIDRVIPALNDSSSFYDQQYQLPNIRHERDPKRTKQILLAPDSGAEEGEVHLSSRRESRTQEGHRFERSADYGDKMTPRVRKEKERESPVPALPAMLLPPKPKTEPQLAELDRPTIASLPKRKAPRLRERSILPPIYLGTFVYPSTPFPYFFPVTPHKNGIFPNTAMTSLDKVLDRDTRVVILIPNTHLNLGLARARLQKYTRVWGGGSPIFRVYTDDSDLVALSIHSGHLSKEYLETGTTLDMRLELRLIPVGALERYVKGADAGGEDHHTWSMGWGLHDGNGVEVIDVKLVPVSVHRIFLG